MNYPYYRQSSCFQAASLVICCSRQFPVQFGARAFQVQNMPLAISTEKVDSVVVATLKGTILAGSDTDTRMKRVTELLDAGETRIVFDLGQLNYADSTGIGTLLRLASAAARKGAAIKLANLTQRIHDVLQTTRLCEVFAIFDGADKAMASFASGP